MDCREARDRMSDYLERCLADAESKQMERHLAVCDGCRSEFEDLSASLQVIHSLPRQEPSIDLWSEFAPKFAEICEEMRPVPEVVRQGYFSRLIAAVREGWHLFAAALRYNMSTRARGYM